MSLQVVSHYRILKKLGAGGMGDIYLAQDLRLNRYAAVKFLSPHFASDPQRLLRFKQEAQLAAAINHPNVLTIYDLDEDEGVNFIVTEFVDGKTLRHAMNERRLSLQQAVNVGIAIASALGAAHDYWVVHRDIKPENVMVRDDGVVKVLDFGLAKVTQGTLFTDISAARVQTLPGVVPGTLQYVAPELLRGEAADPRSDLWSLGAVMYEMLAGRAAFSGKALLDTMHEILQSEPRAIGEDVPSALRSVQQKLLKKEPQERYQTSRELLVDLYEVRDALRASEGSISSVS
ncbi:MAG: serine/threonine-protein kinase [Thermoanaerobaculia bacterium]